MFRRAGLAVAAALAFACAPLAVSTEAIARSNAGAVAAGIIAGAAVGAVISNEMKHPNRVYVTPAPQPAWNQSFSPQPGIICYPAQSACYKAGGGYSGTWTYRIYGR